MTSHCWVLLWPFVGYPSSLARVSLWASQLWWVLLSLLPMDMYGVSSLYIELSKLTVFELFFCCCFETGLCTGRHTFIMYPKPVVKLLIFLPPPLNFWDHRCVPLCPTMDLGSWAQSKLNYTSDRKSEIFISSYYVSGHIILIKFYHTSQWYRLLYQNGSKWSSVVE